MESVRRDPPGFPTDDRFNQAKHYDSLPYLCIEQIARGISGGTVRVTQKRNKARSVAATPDGNQYKALPTPHSQAEDEEYVPVDDGHDLARLFEHVNEVDTLEDWLSDWIVNEELHGEAVLWPVKDEDGFPAELWVVPTAACTGIRPGLTPQYPDGALYVSNWQWGLGGAYGAGAGTSFPLDNRDILRPRRRHPLYRLSGYSPMTAGAKEIDQFNSISEARKKHMDSGFAPEVVVAVDGATSSELERLRSQWEGRFMGSKGSRVIFTDGESVDIDSSGRGAREMDYGSGWEQMTKFVCALWQTSSGVLGLTEADSYAAFYAKLKQHHTLCLGPKARRMGKYLTKHLANAYWPKDRLCVEIDLPAIDDRDQQNAEIQADMTAGTITYNQVQGLRNRPPVGPEGDVPVPIYVKRLEGQLQQAQQQQAIAAGTAPDPTKPSPDTMFGGAGGPPRPDNPDGEGSLPPKVKSRLRSILKSL